MKLRLNNEKSQAQLLNLQAANKLVQDQLGDLIRYKDKVEMEIKVQKEKRLKDKRERKNRLAKTSARINSDTY